MKKYILCAALLIGVLWTINHYGDRLMCQIPTQRQDVALYCLTN